MSNFSLYMIGMILIIGALSYAAYILGIAPVWIAVGALALLGIGVMSGITHTRTKEESPVDQ